jgi:hypothetical protein
LGYERLDGASSDSYAEMNSAYVPSAVPPALSTSCVAGVDCPVQPAACAQSLSSNMVGFPCESACAIGEGFDRQCQPSTCCQAANQYPPSNGEHSELGSGVWTSNPLSVPGGKYTEVRCNAGYELTGRNLGFQLLGDRPNCGTVGFTSSCGFTLFSRRSVTGTTCRPAYEGIYTFKEMLNGKPGLNSIQQYSCI